MNSIIWLGESSTTINGLLISELPPISKPPMRVKETFIDGRDGSIIENLGYSSYDKNVVIGLHGNFDINEVIKYFTGEGLVVFSNEPDKAYTAKIVGQIDYNRLLRYRQATVTFRVQPFKHKANEATTTIKTMGATVRNEGLETSKPKMTIYGSGTVTIIVNGSSIFEYTFPSGESKVIVDSETENAWLGYELKNRNMNGDFPILEPGSNIIKWSGTVTSIEILPRSRWL